MARKKKSENKEVVNNNFIFSFRLYDFVVLKIELNVDEKILNVFDVSKKCVYSFRCVKSNEVYVIDNLKAGDYYVIVDKDIQNIEIISKRSVV